MNTLVEDAHEDGKVKKKFVVAETLTIRFGN